MVFKRNYASGGRKYNTRPFGGKPGKGRGFADRGGGYAGRDSSPQMHEAVCAACGKMAEVPFKPNGRKPVFCRDCFQQEDRAPRENRVQGAFGRSRSPERRSDQVPPSGRPPEGWEKRMAEMNTKLDQIISELEAIKERNA